LAASPPLTHPNAINCSAFWASSMSASLIGRHLGPFISVFGDELPAACDATLGTIGFEGRFNYAAVGTVSNVASRLCDEAKPGQILISPRVLMKVEKVVRVELIGEFTLKGIRRPLAAYNVVRAATQAN
jgi:Adenylate and Guanylate cyclase catalytic domain